MDTHRARMETMLARAHRALWLAAQAAGEGGITGAEDDITQILGEVTRVAEASLKGRPRSRTQMAAQEGLC